MVNHQIVVLACIGFDPHHSPILYYWGIAAVRRGTLTPSCVGSNPATPVTICRRGGIGRRAGLKSSVLNVPVRPRPPV